MKNTLLSILIFLFYTGSLSATNDISITTQDIVYNSDGTTTPGLITIVFNHESYLPVIVDVEGGSCLQSDQTISTGEIYTLETLLTASCAGEYCFTIYSGILTEDLDDDCTIEICVIINVVCENDLISLTQIVDCICSVQESIQAFELNVSDQSTPYAYQWSGPNNFTSTQQSPLITESGDYSVTITNAIGCERIESINIPVCSSFDGGVITTFYLPLKEKHFHVSYKICPWFYTQMGRQLFYC